MKVKHLLFLVLLVLDIIFIPFIEKQVDLLGFVGMFFAVISVIVFGVLLIDFFDDNWNKKIF